MAFAGIGAVTRAAFVSLSLFGLSACQSGESDTGKSMSPDDMSQSRPTGQVAQDELEAFCPPITVRQGTASHSAYAKGGQDDPKKLSYQASIAKASRYCTRADGMMTINISIAGRIVPGPAGAPGALTMPIRIAVTRGEEVLYSQMIKDQVQMGESNAATQFLVKDPNVVIPVPPQRNVSVIVGFDAGAAQ